MLNTQVLTIFLFLVCLTSHLQSAQNSRVLKASFQNIAMELKQKPVFYSCLSFYGYISAEISRSMYMSYKLQRELELKMKQKDTHISSSKLEIVEF